MLKLKLQYFGHLMQRVDSLEKTLMLWDLRELPRVPLRGEGSCGGGGASRESTGSGATEKGLTSRGGRHLRLPLRFGIPFYFTFSVNYIPYDPLMD